MRGVGAIIGGNAAGVVTLDGRILADAPATAALPYNGLCYIGLLPEEAGFYGVTRRLRFEEGRLTACPPDVEAFDWDGLYEILLRCGRIEPPRPQRFPFVAARCAFEGALAVIYYDHGLWLSIEKGGRVQTGFPLHDSATAGTLSVHGRRLVALAQGAPDTCLVLNAGFEPLGRIEADRIALEDGVLYSVQRLDSRRGYEQRTRWTPGEGALLAAETEAGFFTREPADCPLGLWFLEALLAGRDDEAEALLSPRLGLKACEARGFLSDFDYLRPHPSDARVAGIAQRRDGLTQLRLLTFETEGEKIVNILEES